MSLELLREMFRYQAWADDQIVAAVKAHPPAAQDLDMRKRLHHIAVVQRFFVSQVEEREFDIAREQQVPETIEEMAALFEEAHADAERCLASLDPASLDRTLDRPPLDRARPAVRVALMQTVLHSQHHRGQIATRLKEFGVTPPTVDYIVMPRGA